MLCDGGRGGRGGGRDSNSGAGAGVAAGLWGGLSWFLHYLHIFGNTLLNKQQEETFKLLTLAASHPSIDK